MCIIVLYKGAKMTALEAEVSFLFTQQWTEDRIRQSVLHSGYFSSVSYSRCSVSNQPQFAVGISRVTLKIRLKV